MGEGVAFSGLQDLMIDVLFFGIMVQNLESGGFSGVSLV